MADKQVTIVVGPNKTKTVNKQGLQEYLQEQLAKDPSLSNESNRQAIAEWEALGGKLSDIFGSIVFDKGRTASDYNQSSYVLENKVNILRERLSKLRPSDPSYSDAKKNYDEAYAQLEQSKFSEKQATTVFEKKTAEQDRLDKIARNKDLIKQNEEKAKRLSDLKDTKGAADAKATADSLILENKKLEKAAPSKPQIPAGGPGGGTPTKPGDKPFAGVPVPGGSTPSVVGKGVVPPVSGGRGPSVAAKPTTPAKPILTKNDFLAQYGVQAALINSDPGLKALFEKAAKGSWSVQKFQAEFANTDWAKSHAETWQRSETARLSAPATYAQSYNNMRIAIANVAANLGVSITPEQIGSEIKPGEESKVSDSSWRNQNDIVQWALDNNWGKGLDSAALGKHIAAVGQVNLALPGGKAYDYMTQLKQYAADMGMGNLSLTGGKDFFTEAATNLILGAPNASLETYKSKILNDAKNNYKALAPQFDAGLTFKSIAAPYTNTLANLLEIGTDTIDLSATTGYGKMITDALRGTDATNNAPMALYDFEKQVKSNPAWAYTNNARDSIMGGTHDLLKMFGKVS